MNANADLQEIEKFSAMADVWWDTQGALKTLHDINPVRLAFIGENTELSGSRVLDVGCGGGILSEALARAGAEVTGIDLAEKSLQTARAHAQQSGLQIDYRHISSGQLAQEMPAAFDTVVCMELLEHVPDPAAVVRDCAVLVKPGGSVFFSTLNRNLKSYLQAIVAAEYLLGMVERGTHEHSRFIAPAELARMGRGAGLIVCGVRGMKYRVLTRDYVLCENADVNYFMYCRKETQND